MLVARYLTAFVPGLLFGIALLSQWVGRSWRFAPGCLAAVFLAVSIVWASTATLAENAYNFETASYALMNARPRYLIFFWDNPSKPDEPTMQDVGRFFFSRAGQTITVRPVTLPPGQDPNQTLDKTAQPPGSAILWLYDRKLVGAGAIGPPPHLPAKGQAWNCHDFGGGRSGFVACLRNPRQGQSATRPAILGASG